MYSIEEFSYVRFVYIFSYMQLLVFLNTWALYLIAFLKNAKAGGFLTLGTGFGKGGITSLEPCALHNLESTMLRIKVRSPTTINAICRN